MEMKIVKFVVNLYCSLVGFAPRRAMEIEVKKSPPVLYFFQVGVSVCVCLTTFHLTSAHPQPHATALLPVNYERTVCNPLHFKNQTSR